MTETSKRRAHKRARERLAEAGPTFHQKIYASSGARFLAKKYGLTADEAWQAARHPKVVGDHERWRDSHGLPAPSSPISRGRLLNEIARARAEERAAGRGARVLRRAKVRRVVRKSRGEQRAYTGISKRKGEEWRFRDGKVFYTLAGAERHAARVGVEV